MTFGKLDAGKPPVLFDEGRDWDRKLTTTVCLTPLSQSRLLYSEEIIVGAPEELEFFQGSKSQIDQPGIYPEDPTQLPPELAGKQRPPKD